MVIVWLMMVNNNLLGGVPTPLKNMKVSWGYYSHIWKTCSKPPASCCNHNDGLMVLQINLAMKIHTLR